jgi:hypothetical protein
VRGRVGSSKKIAWQLKLQPSETSLRGKRICVTEQISDNQGRPEIRTVWLNNAEGWPDGQVESDANLRNPGQVKSSEIAEATECGHFVHYDASRTTEPMIRSGPTRPPPQP